MEVKFLNLIYQNSDSIEHQGNRDSIQRYLNNGYYIKESRNGYWVLVKPSKVLVTIGNESKRKTFNMKEDICNYYGRIRISQKLIKTFEEDAKKGKIKFTLDSDGSYTIK